MATAVITLFLITHFYVCKMDADVRERRRNISQRETRWSMNSQRLEEIVAELMRPISDLRRSFDTDLSALLEEYLTEAGLHALDAEEAELSAAVPNFVELALLLQQSASIYSRKVDFLYQHVLSVSESLHNNTHEAAPVGAGSAEGARRRRRASVREQFAALALDASAAARRERGSPRPPPTLPRLYVELEPRVLAACDAPLSDYCGEPVGLLQDFHVTWRLQEGLLVEELAGGGAYESSLRALPLTELQAAIAAAAPPSPAPPSPSPPASPAPPPPASDTPPPAPLPPPPEPLQPPPEPLQPPPEPGARPPDRRERKRRSDLDVDHMDGAVLLLMSKKVRQLQPAEEFSVPRSWRRRVLSARVAAVRAQRRAALDSEPEFRGFDISDSIDVGGFPGWSPGEGEAATRIACAARRRHDSDDDDGFFEQSSLGDSDTSRTDTSADSSATTATALQGRVGDWSWPERVAARAAELEARGVDVRGAAAGVLSAALALPSPAPASRLLAAAADKHDVSRLFLATLFLANAGNVEIIQGAPLTLNSFSVRVVSTDERLYSTATAADEQFLR